MTMNYNTEQKAYGESPEPQLDGVTVQVLVAIYKIHPQPARTQNNRSATGEEIGKTIGIAHQSFPLSTSIVSLCYIVALWSKFPLSLPAASPAITMPACTLKFSLRWPGRTKAM
jgi:hypothetical protein